METPYTKVTKIKDRWHCRLYVGKNILNEMAVKHSEDIGLACKEMLRWFDKLGGVSQYANKARYRQSTVRAAVGKIWSQIELNEEKTKNILK